MGSSASLIILRTWKNWPYFKIKCESPKTSARTSSLGGSRVSGSRRRRGYRWLILLHYVSLLAPPILILYEGGVQVGGGESMWFVKT